LSVQFDYRTLRRVEEIRDLDMFIDSKMTFLGHIEAVRVIRDNSVTITHIRCCTFRFSDQISSMPRMFGHRNKGLILRKKKGSCLLTMLCVFWCVLNHLLTEEKRQVYFL
jgi:hypothetical protein